jgi:arylsulfatase A-like enzyme
MDKPNILFVLTDQMRSTAMGCAGPAVFPPAVAPTDP